MSASSLYTPQYIFGSKQSTEVSDWDTKEHIKETQSQYWCLFTNRYKVHVDQASWGCFLERYVSDVEFLIGLAFLAQLSARSFGSINPWWNMSLIYLCRPCSGMLMGRGGEVAESIFDGSIFCICVSGGLTRWRWQNLWGQNWDGNGVESAERRRGWWEVLRDEWCKEELIWRNVYVMRRVMDEINAKKGHGREKRGNNAAR